MFEVQLHSAVNKMNVENLATVMGINLLKPQIEDPFTVMKGGGAHKHTATSVFTSENWLHDVYSCEVCVAHQSKTQICRTTHLLRHDCIFFVVHGLLLNEKLMSPVLHENP